MNKFKVGDRLIPNGADRASWTGPVFTVIQIVNGPTPEEDELTLKVPFGQLEYVTRADAEDSFDSLDDVWTQWRSGASILSERRVADIFEMSDDTFLFKLRRPVTRLSVDVGMILQFETGETAVVVARDVLDKSLRILCLTIPDESPGSNFDAVGDVLRFTPDNFDLLGAIVEIVEVHPSIESARAATSIAFGWIAPTTVGDYRREES